MEGWTYRAGFPLVSVVFVGPEADGVLALAQVGEAVHRLFRQWHRIIHHQSTQAHTSIKCVLHCLGIEAWGKRQFQDSALPNVRSGLASRVD